MQGFVCGKCTVGKKRAEWKFIQKISNFFFLSCKSWTKIEFEKLKLDLSVILVLYRGRQKKVGCTENTLSAIKQFQLGDNFSILWNFEDILRIKRAKFD